MKPCPCDWVAEARLKCGLQEDARLIVFRRSGRAGQPQSIRQEAVVTKEASRLAHLGLQVRYDTYMENARSTAR
jgi:hypothetical protein